MKILSLEPDQLSPGILFNKDTGNFRIFGVSCPEDAVEFYDPIFNWIEEYIETPPENTTLDFEMEYYNSVSAKIFLMIMLKFEELSDSGYNVKVRWFFEEGEDDLEEAGEEFENIVDLDFELICQNRKTDMKSDDEFFDNLLNNLT
jgi:hypothetical protein